MSKILFVNGNLQGHFNPTLPVAAELVDRGEEVWYYCSGIFKKKLESVGVHFLSSDDLEDFYISYRPTGNHPFYSILEYMIDYYKVMLPSLMDKIQNLKFDCLVCDSVLGAGYFIKEIMKLPVISSNTSFVMNHLPVPDRMLTEGFHPQLDEFYRKLYDLCQSWDVKTPSVLDFFCNKGDRNIVYTSRMFNPGGPLFDETYQFVGPSIHQRELIHFPGIKNFPETKKSSEVNDFPFDKIQGQKIVYISLGTINTNFMDFYHMCIEALGNMDYSVVMSIGRKCNLEDFKNIPDNFIISNYVPQLEILKNTSVFISHCGMNSVDEAIYYGVPIIAIPLVNDQPMIAQQIVKLGVGISLKMSEITSDDIKKAVSDILSQNTYREMCRKIQDSFQTAGGYQKAADLIQSLR